jgi:hypothetical protein
MRRVMYIWTNRPLDVNITEIHILDEVCAVMKQISSYNHLNVDLTQKDLHNYHSHYDSS